ncbi:MAG: hypothetical protein QOD99_1949 [Chthoniobacter sp.]|jgi:hypothetical protein|nr:hypothetical protein [Chthoniobacter sp.]
MRRIPLLALLLLGCQAAAALDLAHKTVSLSRQFIVYCDDENARVQIAGFAEDTKKKMLALLAQKDQWKFPIVIKVERAEASNPSAAPAAIQLCDTEEGAKVQLDVRLGADPREIRFEQKVAQAVLLDLAYRDKPPRAGAGYAQPPPWLIEGTVQIFHRSESGGDSGVFKRLMSSDHLPLLSEFLAQEPVGIDAVSQQFYDACAMSLVQLLIDLPNGRNGLTQLLRQPQGDGSAPASTLIRFFPELGATTQSMEKWWALSMARFSAADRYAGFSLPETEARLAAALMLELPGEKPGETRKVALDQFEEFRKDPASRPMLKQLGTNLLALGTQASPLFRPIVSDYRQIAEELARGKTRGIKERLASAAKYRELVLSRIDAIADYLNWFEATQESAQSDSFADYMKTARALAHDEPGKRDDVITRYLDVVQKQMD